MTPYSLVELTQRLLILVLKLSLPIVAAAVLAGLVVGVLQSLTQIQDQSLGFAARLLACVVVMLTLAPWAGTELALFGQAAFELIGRPSR
jgi:type III secretion protein S